MNKILTAFVLLFANFYLSGSLYASPTASFQCAPELQKWFLAILKVPEGKSLVEEVEQEGPIKIATGNSPILRKFGAFWDPDRRMICIYLSPHSSEEAILGSLLFELHNASANGKINRLNQMANARKINKTHYVEAMEHLEYINSKNAAKIARIGVKMGVFPRGFYLPTYDNFQEHFKAQKDSGHSDCFAHNYEMCLRNS